MRAPLHPNFFRITAIGAILIATSCRVRNAEPANVASSENIGSFADCQVGQGYYGEMRICIEAEGVADARVSLMRNWIQDSLDKWSGPTKQVDSTVNLSPVFSCDEPHLMVFILLGKGKGFAGCGVIQAYEKWHGDDALSEDRLQAEILHLTGIAAAAQLPTFEDYGVCLADQAESVMCLAGKSTKRDDSGRAEIFPADVDGVKRAFSNWLAAGKPVPSRDN